MISTKQELIKEMFKGYDLSEKFVSITARKIRRMPELEFIETIRQELKLNLEPIRKNQYILT